MTTDGQVIYSMMRVGRIHPPNKQVLRDISLGFYYGAKIGVLGLNGAGKSTMLRIMAGVDTDYVGEIAQSKGYTTGLLEQEPHLDESKTVIQVVREAVQPIVDMLQRYDEVHPVNKEDLRQKGWRELDVILVTGDAYVDHPSFGVAVIGRVLEHHGFRVGIIAQPDWRKAESFLILGKPRLFFGITSGNVDSMVSNYTANKRPRKKDDYSPAGFPELRPDRAVIVYANRIREAFKDVPIVLGGLEASMRRLAHYDYWENAVRRSILVDARRDMLVYGMGETPGEYPWSTRKIISPGF